MNQTARPPMGLYGQRLLDPRRRPRPLDRRWRSSLTRSRSCLRHLRRWQGRRRRGRSQALAPESTPALWSAATVAWRAARSGSTRPAGSAAAAGARRAVASQPLYWGATIGSQLTGDQAPWDMGAVADFEQGAGKRPRWSILRALRPLRRLRLLLLRVPNRADGKHPQPRLDPGLQLELAVDPLDPRRARLPALRRDRRPLRRLHPRIRRRRPRLGPPLLPPLQLGDERQLVPLVGGRQRQPAAASTSPPGATSTTSSPRSAPATSPGSGARTSTPTASLHDLASLYPGDAYVDWTGLDGYNWGTNPAKPRGWRSFDQLFRRTYHEIVGAIAPSKPMMIGEIGSTEHGGSKANWIRDALAAVPTELPADPRPALVRQLRRRHGLADRDLGAAPPRRSPKESSSRSTSPQVMAASLEERLHRPAEPSMPVIPVPYTCRSALLASPETPRQGASPPRAAARAVLAAVCSRPPAMAAGTQHVEADEAREAEAALLGRLDRRPDHRHQRALGHGRGRLPRAAARPGDVADRVLLAVGGLRPQSLPLLRVPDRRRWTTSAATGRSRSSAGVRESSAGGRRRTARLPARRRSPAVATTRHRHLRHRSPRSGATPSSSASTGR